MAMSSAKCTKLRDAPHGNATHHGQARTDTETRNIYPFFRVVQCSSVVKSSPRFRGEKSSFFLLLPKGYRRDAEGLTKMMYKAIDRSVLYL